MLDYDTLIQESAEVFGSSREKAAPFGCELPGEDAEAAQKR
jgi:hypothetical protein